MYKKSVTHNATLDTVAQLEANIFVVVVVVFFHFFHLNIKNNILNLKLTTYIKYYESKMPKDTMRGENKETGCLLKGNLGKKWYKRSCCEVIHKN